MKNSKSVKKVKRVALKQKNNSGASGLGISKTGRYDASKFHTPVLLEKVIELLEIKGDGTYVDATLGGAGHSFEIYKRLKTGKLISIDRDKKAVEYVQKKYDFDPKKWILVNGRFSDLEKILKELEISQVSGVVIDLGVSSHQIDDSARGFSYMKEGPLDMRMSREDKIKAMDLVNGLYVRELEEIFRNYGEERFAKKISKKIVEARKHKKIETTSELVRIIRKAMPAGHREGHKHPARRVFQALRIAVNSEVEELREVLGQAFSVLQPTGRCVIISFHSLEDRIVKDFIKKVEAKQLLKILIKKPIRPDIKELDRNPRARSAKLRAYTKKANN